VSGDGSASESTALRWAECTSEEVGTAAAAGLVAVLPVGATEQHGPHLATGTDFVLARAAAEAACARTGDIVLPSLALGCSLGHTAHWPGTLSLTPATLAAVVLETGRWVHDSGFAKLVLVNGHGTNGPPCESALLQLRHERPELRARFVSLHELTPAINARYRCDAEDVHANEAETSLVMHVRPGLVRPERAVDEIDRTIGRVFPYPMPDVSVTGVVGKPSQATRETGEELFTLVVSALVELLETARGESAGDLNR
jgi:creatinine amidohydrolase